MLDFMNGFEKDNENPYRPLSCGKRQKIDRWFFERHDHRKTHTKIYETVIRPKFGICENTFLDYRHEPDELLDLFPQPVRIEFSLWLPGYAGQIYESCRSGPVLHNALGCVQQVFQTHTQRRNRPAG